MPPCGTRSGPNLLRRITPPSSLRSYAKLRNVYPLIIFIAESSDGTLIGFLEANLRSTADGCDEKLPVGYLEGWFVAGARRGKGVGTALLRAAEDWARAQGCVEMASDTDISNTVSQRVHQASGFTVSTRGVLYRKPL